MSVVHESNFPVWKTIPVGTCETDNVYWEAFDKADRRAGSRARGLLGTAFHKGSPGKQEIDLAKVPFGALGLAEGVCREVAYARAIEVGLGIPPMQVASYLSLVYDDQPTGEKLIVATEPIPYSTGSGPDFVPNPDDYYLVAIGRGRFFRPWVRGIFCHSLWDDVSANFLRIGACLVFMLPRV